MTVQDLKVLVLVAGSNRSGRNFLPAAPLLKSLVMGRQGGEKVALLPAASCGGGFPASPSGANMITSYVPCFQATTPQSRPSVLLIQALGRGLTPRRRPVSSFSFSSNQEPTLITFALCLCTSYIQALVVFTCNAIKNEERKSVIVVMVNARTLVLYISFFMCLTS